MTYKELGQKIKSKYPQYKNVDDVEIAQKIVKKYPEYQKQITESPQKEKPLWQKVGDKGGKTMQWMSDTFLAPVARAGMTAPVSAYQSLRGQKPHAVNTPFGKVKPFDVMGESEDGLKPKESIGHGVEVALTALPAEKLLKPVAKYVGKLGKNLLTKAGDVLTGVESQRLDKWYDLAKNAPDKLKRTKDIIEQNPDNPYLGMVNKIANKTTKLKTDAQKMFTGAVDTVKKNFPDRTFNLENKIPEMNETLNKYRLKIDRVREGGKMSKNISVTPTTRTSPYTPQDVKMIDDLIQRMSFKNLNIDELLDFDESIKLFFDYATKNENKKLMSLGMELIENSSKFVDDVLPEVSGANKAYRDYYDVMKNLGKNIMDNQGNVKRGSESFIGNILNFNKGVAREEVERAGKKLGLDILGDAENIRNAKQLTESIPNTVRSRVSAIFRSIISSKAFGIGAGAGTAVNPAIGIPALVLNLLSSPNRYRNLIEIIAGTSKKLPVGEVIDKLTPAESFLMRNILKGLDGKED